jgi:hypothetical protein
MAYTLNSLSSGIFLNEFDEDTGLTSQGRISGWLESNIGQVNAAVYTSFDSDLSAPSEVDYSFGHEEATIYTQMFMRNYYSKAVRTTLLGGTVGATATSSSSTSSFSGMSAWTEITEGDTTIKREPLFNTTGSGSTSGSSTATVAQIAAQYRALLESTEEHIESLVADYNAHGAKPQQVSGKDGDV